MDSIETVLFTFLISISLILILSLSSYIRFMTKLKNCQDDLDD